MLYGSDVRRRNGVLALAAVGAALLPGCGGGDQTGAVDEGINVADVGFMTPESVLADTIADVYLVSNINGSPTDQDDNGFISRVTPDGQVEQLKWIDGANPDVTLNAPKGMAIRGDSLFVADIDCIRIFHRVTGVPQARICVPGASFLNDVAIGGQDGSLFVTDTGVRAGASGFEPTGTDAVYRLGLGEGARNSTLAKSADLGGPNGIAVGPRGILVVTFGSGEIFSLDAQGQRFQLTQPSPRQLDGIVVLPDGGFLYSSWGDSAVYRVDSRGQPTKLVSVVSPADIGFDAKRNRVLIPVFMENRVLIRDLPAAPPQ